MANAIPYSSTLCIVKQFAPKKESPSKRGYGRAWQSIRALFLQYYPLCCVDECQELATEVDHINADTHNNAWSNLQPFCKSCHAKKTVKCDGGFTGK